MITAKIGDWIIFNTGMHDRKQVRKVVHVDAKGRLYLHPSRDWRDGYEPETGHSRNSKGRIERLATTEEIADHLRGEEQKAQERERERSRRQSQEYVDMAFIQSTIEHNPEHFMKTFSKEEIHEIAEQLRHK
jgi:hypothetical protein